MENIPMCPLCQQKTLVISTTGAMVQCENYKVMKSGSNWINYGTCDFHIAYKNKAFGNLDNKTMNLLLSGKILKNKKGDKMRLNLESPTFLEIKFQEKKVKQFKRF